MVLLWLKYWKIFIWSPNN